MLRTLKRRRKRTWKRLHFQQCQVMGKQDSVTHKATCFPFKGTEVQFPVQGSEAGCLPVITSPPCGKPVLTVGMLRGTNPEGAGRLFVSLFSASHLSISLRCELQPHLWNLIGHTQAPRSEGWPLPHPPLWGAAQLNSSTPAIHFPKKAALPPHPTPCPAQLLQHILTCQPGLHLQQFL